MFFATLLTQLAKKLPCSLSVLLQVFLAGLQVHLVLDRGGVDHLVRDVRDLLKPAGAPHSRGWPSSYVGQRRTSFPNQQKSVIRKIVVFKISTRNEKSGRSKSKERDPSFFVLGIIK